MPFDEMCRYVGTWLDGVICRSVAIPSCDVWRVCIFAHMMYNVVDHVFMVVFHIFLAAFPVVTSRVVLELVSLSSDNRSGLSLSITNTYGQICLREFFKQLLCVLGLV